MHALVKARPAVGIDLQDIPQPGVGPNDVLIRIKRSAICGTDMHIYNWDKWAQKTIPVPMAVGHEYCGEIVEVGSEVTGFKPGDGSRTQKRRCSGNTDFRKPKPNVTWT